MTVQELSRLHRGYIELSERFKATWTFHQFLQGLRKVFPGSEVGTEVLNFQNVYASLKSISESLSTVNTEQLREDLERVAKELDQRTEVLLDEDSKVSPSLLRQFFGRIKSYDQKILVQLLRFYVLTQRTAGQWPQDRMDKADFLLTKLGEEVQEGRMGEIEADPSRMHDVLHGLWRLQGREAPPDATTSQACARIRAVGTAMGEVETLDQLNEMQLVQDYRTLKQELGSVVFEPRVAMAILETNLLFRRTIQRLYENEERMIAAEYQEVFELERGAPSLDRELDRDLQDFRAEIERFEEHLEHKNVRLNELAFIRQRVRDLIPRLRQAGATVSGDSLPVTAGTTRSGPVVRLKKAAASSSGPVASGAGPESGTARIPRSGPSPGLRVRSERPDLIAEDLDRVTTVLEASDAEAPAKAVAATPEARELRLLARDVVAFRRLQSPEECNQDLERFLLETAAIRVRISRQAEDIVGQVEDGNGGNDEILRAARETSRLADQFQHRYAHFMAQALQEGQFEEAQTLQYHRMRLLRDYAGLWLLAFEP